MTTTKVLGIPHQGTIHIHRASCRDISSVEYHGQTYDTCYHIEVESRTEIPGKLPEGAELVWFPCSKKIKK